MRRESKNGSLVWMKLVDCLLNVIRFSNGALQVHELRAGLGTVLEQEYDMIYNRCMVKTYFSFPQLHLCTSRLLSDQGSPLLWSRR